MGFSRKTQFLLTNIALASVLIISFQNFTSGNNPNPRPTSAPTGTPNSNPAPECPPIPRHQQPTSAPNSVPGSFLSHFRNNGSGYRYADQNCHNSANAGARRDFRNSGIVSCRPDETFNFNDRSGGRGGHTFNWHASPPDRCGNVKVCLWNWGQSCCYQTRNYAEGSAPDLNEYGASLRCMRSFCGDQFDLGNSRALAPGELVEEAGWIRCVKEGAGGNANDPIGDLDLTASESKLRDCQRCCDNTTRLVLNDWVYNETGERACFHEGQTEVFSEKCHQECRKYFSPNPRPSPRSTPRR